MVNTKRSIFIHALIIYLGGFLTLLGLGAIFHYLGYYSHVMAEMYPEVAYMRVPILIIMRIFLVLVAGILIIGCLVVHRIVRGQAYHARTSKLLDLAAILAYVGAADMFVMIVYTSKQVSGSITNLWCLVGALVLIAGASLLQLLSNLILRGSELQEEHDLTI